MGTLAFTGIIIATAVTMEFVAWFSHKYIMHGFLWSWHEDHHQPHQEGDGFFEKNDLFFLVFAVPSMLSFVGGATTSYTWLTAIGIGICIYGAIYFLIHDVYIHQRFKWFRQLDSRYSRGILRAHGAHHASQEKEEGESFGLLIVAAKFFKKRSKWTEEDKQEKAF